jgi:hypothetical protein
VLHSAGQLDRAQRRGQALSAQEQQNRSTSQLDKLRIIYRLLSDTVHKNVLHANRSVRSHSMRLSNRPIFKLEDSSDFEK